MPKAPQQFIKEYTFLTDAQTDIDELKDHFRALSITSRNTSPYDSSIVVLFEERI